MAAFAILGGDVAGHGASTAQLVGVSAHKSWSVGQHHIRTDRRDRTTASRSARRTTLNAAVAKRDAAQTASLAQRTKRNSPGYCLNWARTRAHIPAVYPDAATAWRHARDKHGSWNPPRGAAVYWTGGSHGYGHIAISVGHGLVRSTDAGGEGLVATVRVGWPVRNWGLHYAGWSDTINGYKIPGVVKRHPSHQPSHKASHQNSHKPSHQSSRQGNQNAGQQGHASGTRGGQGNQNASGQNAVQKTADQSAVDRNAPQVDLPSHAGTPSPGLVNAQH